MKILMLTDEFGCGGAQTHISSLAKELSLRGHKVIVASSGGEAVRTLTVPHITLPLNQKRPLACAVSLLLLNALVKKERFDIIHAHARLPASLCQHIAKNHGICFVTTVHARFPLSPIRTSLSRWGSMSIAVSEDLKQYLIEAYRSSPQNIEVIPNGIDTRAFPLKAFVTKEICIATLSRLDCDCALTAHLLCRLAVPLCHKYGRLKILIGGGGSEYENVKKSARSANKQLGFECVYVVGKVYDIPAFMHSASVFAGVGRAAIEAALCGIPTVICGDEGFGGLLTPQGFTSALSCNFCARECKAPTEALLLSELCTVIDSQSGTADTALRQMLVEHCDIRRTTDATEQLYRRAMRLKKKTAVGGDVVLCGYYGYSNVGDDALLHSAVQRARCEFDGMKITALTRYGKRQSEYFGVACRNRSSLLEASRAIRHSKYFILGGGTLLQDSTSLRSLLFYSALLLYAKACGADCRIWGGGIGELSRPLSVCITAAVLRACSYCGLRDIYSQKSAKRLLKGSPQRTVSLEDDLARTIPPCTDTRAEYLLSRVLNSKQKQKFVLAVPNGRCDISPLCRAVRCAKRKQIFPLFVIMHRKEDKRLCRTLAERFGGAVLEDICFADLVGIAKRSCGVYSMRLHALIAADMAGVPAHAFGDDIKLRGYKSNF